MRRRLLVGLFALCLALGLCPVSALATDTITNTASTNVEPTKDDSETIYAVELATAEGSIKYYNNISDALDAADGQNSIITLHDEVDSISINGKKNITINGNNNIIHKISLVSCENITLQNAQFNLANESPAIDINSNNNHITISNCIFNLNDAVGESQGPWSAIYVQSNANNLLIDGNTFSVTRADNPIQENLNSFQCIGFAYTDNMRAKNIEISNNKLFAYQTDYAYFVIGGCSLSKEEYGITNLKIDNNLIQSDHQNNQMYALSLADVDGLTVTENTFNCSVGLLIMSDDSNSACKNVSVTKNQGTASRTIFLFGSQALTGALDTDVPSDKINSGEYATVTFDATGGFCEKQTIILSTNEAIGELPRPTRSGSYEFVGWYDSATNTPVSPETTFTKNATLYAVWRYTGPVSYGVSVSEAENGTVTTDRTYACAGTTVTITATPDEGYDLTGVSVVDGNGSAIEVTANDDGTYSFTMPTGGVTVTASFAASLPFSDVRPGDWYYEAVSRVYAGGLMTGYDDGSGLFGADDELTREQSAMILFRALGAQGGAPACGLTDVAPGSWYADAVDWAFSTGLMTGYGDGSNRLGVGEALTREQLAVMLYRIAGSPDAGDYDPSAFSDGDEASEWARGALAWAVSTGVLEGSDDGQGGTELRPTAPITRAEMATMLSRLSDEGLLK